MSKEFPFEDAIAARAEASGLRLDPGTARALAGHARSVLAANERLHLTTIVEPEQFLERHIGESFEGASLLDPGVHGTLLDLGSGNGYPGLPLAAVRTGLRAVLTEASVKKAGFLRAVLVRGRFANAEVLERQVQRAADLEGIGPVRVLASRAMGAWEKIVPRLASVLDDEGEVLLWAGDEAEKIFRRKIWQRLEPFGKHLLPGRERSSIWQLRKH
jgi:16S rRNA G527 N7-methylase RsmG